MSIPLEIENASLKSRVQAAEMRLHAMRLQPDKERDELAYIQARMDGVARHFGTAVSAPVPGETALAYRKRLLRQYQKHSDRFATARLDSLDAGTLGPIEDLIIDDAIKKARDPNHYPAGTLIPIVTREGGRDVTRFAGDMLAWMAPFMTAGNVGQFNLTPGG